MIVVYIILGILTASVVLYGIHLTIRADELDDREEELNKYSVHLDERDNRIAADEKTLREMYKELKEEIEKRKK